MLLTVRVQRERFNYMNKQELIEIIAEKMVSELLRLLRERLAAVVTLVPVRLLKSRQREYLHLLQAIR